jgi:hypothetical protein
MHPTAISHPVGADGTFRGRRRVRGWQRPAATADASQMTLSTNQARIMCKAAPANKEFVAKIAVAVHSGIAGAIAPTVPL